MNHSESAIVANASTDEFVISFHKNYKREKVFTSTSLQLTDY